MTSQQILTKTITRTSKRTEFSSSEWLMYFHKNRDNHVEIFWPNCLSVPTQIAIPVINSLQRFQVGETGDGTHLRKFARTMNDPIYEQCIELFVREENGHANVLAQIIQMMNGRLITWHWSDFAFVSLRHLMGLKTEIFIILTAEIVGKCFYQCCAHSLPDTFLQNTFTSIVRDEQAHLKFHWSFMCREMRPLNRALKRLIFYFWSAIFLAICLVFIVDHGAALKALNTSPEMFLYDCWNSISPWRDASTANLIYLGGPMKIAAIYFHLQTVVSSFSLESKTNTARSFAGFVLLAFSLTPCLSPGFSEKLSPSL